MRHRGMVLTPAMVLASALATIQTHAQPCDPAALWQNANHVTRATSDAQFGLGLSFVVTGPMLRAVWNESGSAPIPHVAGETRWVWSTGGPTIENFPNPVVLSSDNKEYIFVGGSDGFLYKIDAATGMTAGSADTRRSLCPSDKITATPAVQLYAYSNATFKNNMNMLRGHADDLVIVVTKTGCADQTSNRVIGFFASDLMVKWVFNEPAAESMGGASDGCTVDYATNRLYCGTEQSLPTQPTLWAFDSVSGAKAWSYNAGSIKNRPTLYLGSLYLVTSSNQVEKRVASSGGVIWVYPFPAPIARTGSWQNKILALDSNGAMHAIEDVGTTAVLLWGPISPGAGLEYVSGPAVAPEHGKAYLGRNDGRVQQVELATGAMGPLTSAISTSPVWDPTLDYSDPTAALVNRLIVPYTDGTIVRYCIPWGGPTAVPEPLTEASRFGFSAGPNPTARATRMEFELPFAARVEIDVYAVTGRRIRSLVRTDRHAGRHEAHWDGLDDAGQLASAGMYLLRLRALGGDGRLYEQSRKIELLH